MDFITNAVWTWGASLVWWWGRAALDRMVRVLHNQSFLFTLVRAADANLWQIVSASWMAAFTLSWFPHRQHKSELVWATAGWSASAWRARYIWNIKIRIRFASISSKSQFCLSLAQISRHSCVISSCSLLKSIHCGRIDLSHWPYHMSSKAPGLTEQRKTRMTGWYRWR